MSRDLRNVVDRSKPAYTDIQVTCSANYMILDFNFRILVYSNHYVLNYLHFPILIYPYEEYARTGHNDLKFALGNSKLKLNSLRISASSDANYRFHYRFPRFSQELMENQVDLFIALRSFGHKIHVENCSIYVDYEMDAMQILECLKPGALKYLSLEEDRRIEMLDRGDHLWIIRDLAQTEQWKQAEHLRMAKRIRLMESEIQHFFHFKTFEISVDSISVNDVVELIALSQK